jgi:choline dehydrogenase-like flavoprotein
VEVVFQQLTTGDEPARATERLTAKAVVVAAGVLGSAGITVHPLGGCPMGDSAATGVVDHAGRVFSDDGKTLQQLYVADASVIPTSLGVNPLWTISALAERISEAIAIDLGLKPGASTTLKGYPASASAR